MRYLLDASALVPLIVDCGEELVSRKLEAAIYTTELGVYEAGNALWKLTVLVKSITRKDSSDLLSTLHYLIRRGIVNLVSVLEADLSEILEIAVRERITFYDASYVAIARRRNLTLATEDEELREKAAKYVSIIPYSDLKTRICQSNSGSH